jgi:hypothetical protein
VSLSALGRLFALAAALTVAAGVIGAPATAMDSGPFGTYRLVDPIQRPPEFTLRLMRPGTTCRRVARTSRSCFTLRQRGTLELVGVGRLIVSGHRMLFRDNVTGACPDSAGRYSWQRRSAGLRVTTRSDRCAGRRHLFAAGLWRRT